VSGQAGLKALYQEIEDAWSNAVNDRGKTGDATWTAGKHYHTMVPADVREYIAGASTEAPTKTPAKTPANTWEWRWKGAGDREWRIRGWAPPASPPDVDAMWTKMVAWFRFLDRRAPVQCSQRITVYLYLTPLTKTLPDGQGTATELSESHVNSAFTQSCQLSNEIYIFREEEWWKVLMHECIHALGLDFSWYPSSDDLLVPQIQQVFPGTHSDHWAVTECWTETWAEILVLLFQVREFIGLGASWSRVAALLQRGLMYETTWSQIQCIKVLDHYGVTYAGLLAGDTYRETKTAVFSYYVLRCLIMTHLPAFLAWNADRAGTGTGTGTGKDEDPSGFWSIFTKKRDKTEVRDHILALGGFLVAVAQDARTLRTLREDRVRGSRGNELRMSLWGGEMHLNIV
jgi:hypothetical protein